MKRLLGIFPHLSLILSLMLLTFYVTDRFNTAMVFINHPMTKELITGLIILDLIVAIRLAFLRSARTYALRTVFSLLTVLTAIGTIALQAYDNIYPASLLFTMDSVKAALCGLAVISAASAVILIICQRRETASASASATTSEGSDS